MRCGREVVWGLRPHVGKASHLVLLIPSHTVLLVPPLKGHRTVPVLISPGEEVKALRG